MPGGLPGNGSNRRIGYGRGSRVVVTDHAGIIREETPPATRTANNGVGVDRVAHRRCKTIARPSNDIAFLYAGRQIVVNEAGQCGRSDACAIAGPTEIRESRRKADGAIGSE